MLRAMRVAFSILLVGVLSACATSPQKVQEPFLWEASKDGRRIYFLGTIHGGIPLKALPAYIPKIIKSSDIVFTEIDFATAKQSTSGKYQKFFEKYYADFDKPYPKLMSRLSETAQSNVSHMLTHPASRAYARTLGITFPADYASPALVDLIYSKVVVENRNYDVLSDEMLQNFVAIGKGTQHLSLLADRSSLDEDVYSLAVKNKIRLASLDTAEFVTGFFDEMTLSDPYEYGIKKIEAIFGDQLALTAKFMKDTGKLIAGYRTGNLEKITFVFDDVSDVAMKKLIVDRNQAWVKTLLNRKDSKIAFVAAGVGHFIGEQSLLRLMEKGGYKVTRLGSQGSLP